MFYVHNQYTCAITSNDINKLDRKTIIQQTNIKELLAVETETLT